jgi:hypothetical protein
MRARRRPSLRTDEKGIHELDGGRVAWFEDPDGKYLRDRRGGSMSMEFPGESEEYRAARERLLRREIELRREMEAVAAERRKLPPGGAVPEDYVYPADARTKEFLLGSDS